jgi:hypothetical protein
MVNVRQVLKLCVELNGGIRKGLVSESIDVVFFDVEKVLLLIENEEFKHELLLCLNYGAEPFYISF